MLSDFFCVGFLALNNTSDSNIQGVWFLIWTVASFFFLTLQIRQLKQQFQIQIFLSASNLSENIVIHFIKCIAVNIQSLLDYALEKILYY